MDKNSITVTLPIKDFEELEKKANGENNPFKNFVEFLSGPGTHTMIQMANPDESNFQYMLRAFNQTNKEDAAEIFQHIKDLRNGR